MRRWLLVATLVAGARPRALQHRASLGRYTRIDVARQQQQLPGRRAEAGVADGGDHPGKGAEGEEEAAELRTTITERAPARKSSPIVCWPILPPHSRAAVGREGRALWLLRPRAERC